MKKKIVFFFLLFGLSLAIAYPTYASLYTVKAPKKVKLEYGNNSVSKKIKVYFKGRNITDDCSFKARGISKKIVDADYGRIYINTRKFKKRTFSVLVDIKFNPSKIEPWEDTNEINYFFKESNYFDYYTMDFTGGDTYNVDGDNVDSYFFGNLKTKDFFKAYTITQKIKFKIKPNKKPIISGKHIKYDKYSNTFKVSVKNLSSNQITILGSGAKVETSNKKNDRRLKTKMGKKIRIKSNKTKTIYLSVIGKKTDLDHYDIYDIVLKIKYKGKKFKRVIVHY